MSQILSFEETVARIQSGSPLLITGYGSQLAKLPAGHWIGGIAPIAMKPQGSGDIGDHFCVTEVPDYATNFKICTYDVSSIDSLPQEAYENGYSMIALPLHSDVHLRFASNAPDFPDLFLHPLIGFVASNDSMKPDGTPSCVFNGETRECFVDRVVVMHVELPPHLVATIGIIAVYEQDDGPDLCFGHTGFTASRCTLDGVEQPLSPYLKSKMPADVWVANYLGAMINLHARSYDHDGDGEASFYGPFFKGVTYRHARSGIDYAKRFREEVSKFDTKNVILALNCVGNYITFKLEGSVLNELAGFYSFGEVAYQQLNATYVYLKVLPVESGI